MAKYLDKLLYVCDFDFDIDSGKNRATRQKTQALMALCPNGVVFSLKKTKLRLLKQVLLELRVCWKIVTYRPKIVISRGFVGWLFQFLCKLMGIRTAREIHADLGGEVKLLPYGAVKKYLIRLLAKISLLVDRSADIRIFNHPVLLDWFHKEYGGGIHDFYSYNGYGSTAYVEISRDAALKKFGLSAEKKYLTFVGVVTKWRGADYLVDLQRAFTQAGDNVQIVCGGGDMSAYDPEGLCLNFSPLDDKGCAELVRASSLCLLPVKNNRVSPGNPLKLYDYMCNKRYVVSQADTLGYSDEVEKHGVGISVDFAHPTEARVKILAYLASVESRTEEQYPAVRAAWSDRMAYWMEQIKASMAKAD